MEAGILMHSRSVWSDGLACVFEPCERIVERRVSQQEQQHQEQQQQEQHGTEDNDEDTSTCARGALLSSWPGRFVLYEERGQTTADTCIMFRVLVHFFGGGSFGAGFFPLGRGCH